MKSLFLVLFLVSITGYTKGTTPAQEGAKIEYDIESGKLAERTEKALSNLIYLACDELMKRGYKAEAMQFYTEWENEWRFTFRSYASQMTPPDIGDHKPLSKWLADKYDMLELLIGVEKCKTMHLSDLKTFNFCIPIAFRPCSYDLDGMPESFRQEEYKNHFAQGNVYYGLVPVTTYWIAYGACVFGTSGTGFVLVCGTLGGIAEKLVGQFVAPRLSDMVYTKACGGA